METVIHQVKSVTFSDCQDRTTGNTCRKLCVQTSDGQVLSLALFDFADGVIEDIPYHPGDRPHASA